MRVAVLLVDHPPPDRVIVRPQVDPRQRLPVPQPSHRHGTEVGREVSGVQPAQGRPERQQRDTSSGFTVVVQKRGRGDDRALTVGGEHQAALEQVDCRLLDVETGPELRPDGLKQLPDGSYRPICGH